MIGTITAPLFSIGQFEQTQSESLFERCFVDKSETVVQDGFTSRIRPQGEEKKELKNNPKFRAKRWDVEVCNSKLKRFRKLCPRYEKTAPSFVALLTLAIGMTDYE